MVTEPSASRGVGRILDSYAATTKISNFAKPKNSAEARTVVERRLPLEKVWSAFTLRHRLGVVDVLQLRNDGLIGGPDKSFGN